MLLCSEIWQQNPDVTVSSFVVLDGGDILAQKRKRLEAVVIARSSDRSKMTSFTSPENFCFWSVGGVGWGARTCLFIQALAMIWERGLSLYVHNSFTTRREALEGCTHPHAVLHSASFLSYLSSSCGRNRRGLHFAHDHAFSSWASP